MFFINLTCKCYVTWTIVVLFVVVFFREWKHHTLYSNVFLLGLIKFFFFLGALCITRMVQEYSNPMQLIHALGAQMIAPVVIFFCSFFELFIVYLSDQCENDGERNILIFPVFRFYGNGGYLGFHCTCQGTYNFKTASSNAVKRFTRVEDV